MIIAVNVALRDTLKETLEEIARRLGRARHHAQTWAIYPVRVFGRVAYFMHLNIQQKA